MKNKSFHNFENKSHFFKITHNYWLKFQNSVRKHNQKASKATHSHQAWKNTPLTSPSTGLVFRSPPRKQILKLQAKTEQNWAFNSPMTFSKCGRENSPQYTNIIHLSCLPLNGNFSHIKDTMLQVGKDSLICVRPSTSFSTSNCCNWCQISTEIGTWQELTPL